MIHVNKAKKHIFHLRFIYIHWSVSEYQGFEAKEMDTLVPLILFFFCGIIQKSESLVNWGFSKTIATILGVDKNTVWRTIQQFELTSNLCLKNGIRSTYKSEGYYQNSAMQY